MPRPTPLRSPHSSSSEGRPAESDDHLGAEPPAGASHEVRVVELPIDPARPTHWAAAELLFCIVRDLVQGCRRHPRVSAGLVGVSSAFTAPAWWPPLVRVLRHMGAHLLGT
jgi:hypothetical protein